MVTIKERALSWNTSHRVHGSPTVLRQTSHPYTKAAGRLPVQSGIDRFSGLGAKLRNKNKKSRPPLFVPTLHNASYIPSKRSPAGKEDSVRSSVDWAQFKAKKRGGGEGCFLPRNLDWIQKYSTNRITASLEPDTVTALASVSLFHWGWRFGVRVLSPVG